MRCHVEDWSLEIPRSFNWVVPSDLVDMTLPRSPARFDPLGVGACFSRFLRISPQRNSALMRMPAVPPHPRGP
jgi:hypothetical protein